MVTAALPTQEIKTSILLALARGSKTKQELILLPCFRNAEDQRTVAIAIGELAFERMIEKDFGGKYIIPNR